MLPTCAQQTSKTHFKPRLLPFDDVIDFKPVFAKKP